MKTLATMNHKYRFYKKLLGGLFCGLFCHSLCATEVSDVLFRIDEPLIITDYKVENVERPNPLKSNQLMSEKLTQALEKRYYDDFGYSNIKPENWPVDPYTQINYGNGRFVSAKEDLQNKQEYGQYILRKVTEFQVSSYAKRNKNLNKIYKVKEKYSKLNLKVRQGYKVRLKYSLAEDRFYVKLDNPYSIKLQFLIDFSENEQTLEMEYPINKKTNFQTLYKANEHSLSFIGEKKISTTMTASITSKSYLKGEPKGLIKENSFLYDENLILLGLKWRM